MKTAVFNSKEFYQDQPADYYARQMTPYGRRGQWFRERQQMTGNMVSHYFHGGLILDIGCGNCLWHEKDLPVIGVDICASMLRHNISRIPDFVPVKADALEPLPFRNNSVDAVVVTEFLEHTVHYEKVVAEIYRVLKPGGTVVCSVPFGGFPFFWNILFNGWCFYRAWRYGDAYYRNKCGHKVDFTPSKMRRAFGLFRFVEMRSLYFLTMFFVFRKASVHDQG